MANVGCPGGVGSQMVGEGQGTVVIRGWKLVDAGAGTFEGTQAGALYAWWGWGRRSVGRAAWTGIARRAAVVSSSSSATAACKVP